MVAMKTGFMLMRCLVSCCACKFRIPTGLQLSWSPVGIRKFKFFFDEVDDAVLFIGCFLLLFTAHVIWFQIWIWIWICTQIWVHQFVVISQQKRCRSGTKKSFLFSPNLFVFPPLTDVKYITTQTDGWTLPAARVRTTNARLRLRYSNSLDLGVFLN